MLVVLVSAESMHDVGSAVWVLVMVLLCAVVVMWCGMWCGVSVMLVWYVVGVVVRGPAAAW